MNLKTFDSFDKMRFAYLIDPEVPNARCDEDLYEAVRKNGRAVIRPFDGASLKLQSPETLTPDEFQKTWRGD